MAPLNVWMYWEGPKDSEEPPPLIRLCFEAARRHVGDDVSLHLLNQEKVAPWLPSEALDPRWRSLKRLAHRADYVRSRVLYYQGGLWVDADAICFSGFAAPLRMLRDFSLCGWRNEKGLSIGFLAARSEDASIARWIRSQDAYLDANSFAVPAWDTIGTPLLSRELDWDEVYLLPSRLVAPIRWWDSDLLLSTGHSPSRWLTEETLTIQLYYSRIMSEVSVLDRASIISSRRLMSRFLRIALGISEPKDERWLGDLFGPTAYLWRKKHAQTRAFLDRVKDSGGRNRRDSEVNQYPVP